jgi:hypothetical protein
MVMSITANNFTFERANFKYKARMPPGRPHFPEYKHKIEYASFFKFDIYRLRQFLCFHGVGGNLNN